MSKRDDLALLRRRKQGEAIAFANQGDWTNAADANTAMLYDGLSPVDLLDREEEVTIGDLVAKSTDVETLNRLAKAQYELGNVEFARQIYQRVLSVNENNQIAKRMISLLDHTNTRANKDRKFADMRTFVVETGKSTITTMHIDQAVAIALVPGEIVEMRIVGNDSEDEMSLATAIDIYDAGNTHLGRLDPRLAKRIINFMQQGNKYIAVVWRVSEHYHMIDLVIRESYRNPDLTGEVSFPGKLNDEEKSALLDPIDDDIDETTVDDPYTLDIEEEAPRISTYDDDDDNFDGGDESADGDDDVEEFTPKKGKAGTRSANLMSLDDVQRDETRKNTDHEDE